MASPSTLVTIRVLTPRASKPEVTAIETVSSLPPFITGSPTSGNEKATSSNDGLAIDTRTPVQPPNLAPTEAATPGANTNNGGDDGNFMDRGASIILIVMLSLLVGISVWIITWVTIRRRRAARNPELPQTPFFSNPFRRQEPYERPKTASSGDTLKQSTVAGAEIGCRQVPSGLSQGTPRGTTQNPAELDGRLLAEEQSSEQSSRLSWLEQVTRLMGSSRAESRTSHASSGQTRGRSYVRPPTIRESFGEKVNDPAAVLGYRPRPPSSMYSRQSRGSRAMTKTVSQILDSYPPPPPPPPKVGGIFDRTSRDAFGPPRTRGFVDQREGKPRLSPYPEEGSEYNAQPF